MRSTISQPVEFWSAWKRAAVRDGSTLSAWIAEQCNAALPDDERNSLPQRKPAHRPTKEKS